MVRSCTHVHCSVLCYVADVRRDPDALFMVLRTAVKALLPGRARRELRFALAGARSRALSLAPLSIVESVRTRTGIPLRPVPVRARGEGSCHFLLLAGVPIGDSGGGQRPAQMARELLRRGYRVTYVHRFESAESPQGNRPTHERLATLPFSQFSARGLARALGPSEALHVVVSLPVADFRVAARFLKVHAGARTLYDCIDDWDSVLGGGWYSRHAEDRLAREADALVASARSLATRLRDRTGREAALLPNAVDAGLFRRDLVHARPASIREGRPVFFYSGALWGHWLDWSWLRALARARPDADVLLAGEYRGECRESPPNLRFLGLLPQAELPGLMAHSAVCLIPFKVDRMVEGVSPLKVFEYLAMGRPVVASAMPEVVGLPGVSVASTAEEFVALVALAERRAGDPEATAAFAAANSWSARVEVVETLLGIRCARAAPPDGTTGR